MDEELDVTAEQGGIDDLAKGEVALAIVGDTWSGYDGKKLVVASNRNGKVQGETNVFSADWVK